MNAEKLFHSLVVFALIEAGGKGCGDGSNIRAAHAVEHLAAAIDIPFAGGVDEEQQVILPAIMAANEEGIQAFGPYSPDGFFGLGNYSKFDAVLAMYHDQGLTPFKALAFEDGVNYTAGLPIVRTSPDHGTAYEMAGRDLADPRSMMAAIYTAIDIYNCRERYDDLVENKMKIVMPDTEIKPKGGRIIE